jgi:hypothetical protein
MLPGDRLRLLALEPSLDGEECHPSRSTIQALLKPDRR